MKKLIITLLNIAVLSLGHSTLANASIIAGFLGSSDYHVTFDEAGLASGDIVTNQYASLGVTISGGIEQRTAFNDPNLHGGGLYSPGNTFEISFSGVITEADFAMATNPGGTLIELLLNGSLVESAVIAFPSTHGGWVAMTNSFDTIRVSLPYPGALIDNLHFSGNISVPAPTGLLMLLAGLLAVGFRGLRYHR